MTFRDIVILANSRRHQGHCIAGKDIITGEWIRPINILGRGQIRNDQATFQKSDFQALMEDSSGPQLLDCIRIGFGDKCGNYCQPENQFIDGKKWFSLTSFSQDKVSELIDGSSVRFIGKDDNYSDFYPADVIKDKPLESSLNFVRINQVENMTKIIHTISFSRNPQHRLIFEYDSKPYNIVITDYAYEDSVKKSKNDDTKIIEDCYITIGVGEVYRPRTRDIDLHYRLIVGIIPTYTLR
jgi:plasmid maintenance system killer protein